MQIPKTIHRAIPAVLAFLVVLPAAVFAAGGAPSSSSAAADPKAMAKDAYNRALKYRDKAWEYEAKASAADSEKDREKYEKKASKEYGKARNALESAVDDDPNLYQAHSSLGYVLRKTGDYESSLAAYNRALQINPRYTEAIEYRAEAYLGLNRLDEAKEAYMELFRTDMARAAELMRAMQKWVATRQVDAAGVDAAVISEFSGWVDERASLAEQVGDASGGSW